jgi:aminopeptidase N
VLKQLVAWIGEEAFFAGVNQHFAAHRFGNSTLADLLGVLTKTGGRDLSAWSEAWLRRPELNTLRPEVTVAADGTYTRVAIRQTAPEQHHTLRPHRLALGLYDRGPDGSVTRRELIELDIEAGAEQTVVPGLAGVPAADLLLPNDGDLTYAKIRLDDASLATVPQILPLIGDSLARAVIWASILDTVKDGERPVAELVTLALAALPVETEVAIVEDVLSTTRRLVDRYSTPETRPAALEMIAQASDRLLAASSAGSSRQLAAVRGLIAATVDGPRLRGWLAGDDVPEGLAIDAEMRWLILYRLVVLGVATAAEIDAEFERDHTAAGEHFAARCRAALPDREAKERAWTAIVTDAGTSARLADAMAMGFWQPEQVALTEPYVARYFAEMPEMMRIRGGTGAERLAVAAYPRYAVDPETRRLAADLLAVPDLNATLRRTVTDEDDDIRRALHARE